MTTDDLNSPCKIQKRENFILKLEDFEEHLEDDNASEGLKSLETALLYYEKPEIYEEVDVELVHFLMRLIGKISLDKKKKFGSDIKKVLIEIRKIKSNDSFGWLLDFIELLLVYFPNSENELNILSLKTLIKKYPDVMELRLALAISIAKNACTKRDESAFQESFRIYEELDHFFQKNMKLSDHWRLHFPPNPRKQFLSGRILTILNYALYLKFSERYQASIALLDNTLKSDWIKKTDCADINKLKAELRGVCSLQMIKKTPTVQNIGTQFNTHINNSPNCHVEQGKNATCKNTISQGIYLKNLSINTSQELKSFPQDKDAKSKTRWQKLKMILSEILFFAPIIDMIKTIFNFF